MADPELTSTKLKSINNLAKIKKLDLGEDMLEDLEFKVPSPKDRDKIPHQARGLIDSLTNLHPFGQFRLMGWFDPQKKVRRWSNKERDFFLQIKKKSHSPLLEFMLDFYPDEGVNEEELRKVEDRFQITFPTEYRGLQLAANGAVLPGGLYFIYPLRKTDYTSETVFDVNRDPKSRYLIIGKGLGGPKHRTPVYLAYDKECLSILKMSPKQARTPCPIHLLSMSGKLVKANYADSLKSLTMESLSNLLARTVWHPETDPYHIEQELAISHRFRNKVEEIEKESNFFRKVMAAYGMYDTRYSGPVTLGETLAFLYNASRNFGYDTISFGLPVDYIGFIRTVAGLKLPDGTTLGTLFTFDNFPNLTVSTNKREQPRALIFAYRMKDPKRKVLDVYFFGFDCLSKLRRPGAYPLKHGYCPVYEARVKTDDDMIWEKLKNARMYAGSFKEFFLKKFKEGLGEPVFFKV